MSTDLIAAAQRERRALEHPRRTPPAILFAGLVAAAGTATAVLSLAAA